MKKDDVLNVYVFDSASGIFSWRKTGRKGVRPGRVGFVSVQGYVRIRVLGRYHAAHRLAWLVEKGHLPEKQIDHINGNRADNRIDNLREVDPVVNSQNQRRAHPHSKTGLLGASPVNNIRLISKRWRAQIKVLGKNIHLGLFDNPESAHMAYLDAKRKHHEGCTI